MRRVTITVWAELFVRQQVRGTSENSEMRSFAMDFGKFRFGGIKIDGVTYEHNVVIDRGIYSSTFTLGRGTRVLKRGSERSGSAAGSLGR